MKATLYLIKVPLKQAFMHAAHIRRHTESLILCIEHENIIGLGECAPRNYVTGETINSIFEAIQDIQLDNLFGDLNFSSLDNAIYHIKNSGIYKIDISNNLRCMLEMALFDWLGKHYHVSMADILKKYFLYDEAIVPKVNLITSQVLDMSLSAKDFIEKWGPFHTVKIKAYADWRNNIYNIKTVRKALGHDIPIIIDANMAWNLKTAIENINMYQDFNVTYYEEPLAKRQWQDYQELRNKTSVKIMLDESLCTPEDAIMAVKHKSADAFNIRLAKCGGMVQAILLMQFAKQHKLDFQIGAQVAEVGPLIAAARHLASVSSGYITFEAGQADRQLNDNYIVTPMSLVDRTTNLAPVLLGDGLGIAATEYLSQYSQQMIHYEKGVWA